MFTIKCSKVTGNPDSFGWVQVHDFTPDVKEKQKVRGRLIATIALKNLDKEQSEISGVSQGREVLARLHEEYYGNSSLSAFSALSTSVAKVADEFSSNGSSVEIAAAAYVGHIKPTLFVSVSGGSSVKIARQGSFATLLKSTKEVVSASGYPKEGDVIFLGTKRFFDELSEVDLKSARKSSENLAAKIRAVEGSSAMGAAIISFTSRDELQIKKSTQVSKESDTKSIKLEKPRKRIAGFLDGLESKIPKRSPRIKKDLVDVNEQKNRKLAITVGVILLLVLGVSIFFGIRQKRIRDIKQSYESRLSQAIHEFDQAQGLVGVNRERARELLISARATTEELISEGIKDDELDSLKQSIEESQGAILGEYKQNPQLFVDLSLISDGFSGDDLAASEENLYVFDGSSKRVIEIEIKTKGAKVVAGPGEIDDGSEALAAYSSRVFLMDGNGIDEVKEGKVVDKSWGDNSEIYSYAGNLYVLDRSGDDILRFSVTTSGFADGSTWLAPGIEIDLSDVASWSIDGSMWLLFDSGRILKLLNGAQATYSASGIFPELISADVIYTNEELGNVYILDKENKRIVVTDKEGEFVAQYLSDDFSNAKDFVVSETEKKIILLSRDKLLSIEINHLE